MKKDAKLKSEIEYNAAVSRVMEIFDTEPSHPDFSEFQLLLLLLKEYEDKHHVIASSY